MSNIKIAFSANQSFFTCFDWLDKSLPAKNGNFFYGHVNSTLIGWIKAGLPRGHFFTDLPRKFKFIMFSLSVVFFRF